MQKALLLAILLTTYFPLAALTFSPYVQISPTGNNSTPELAVSSDGSWLACWVNFPTNTIQAAFFFSPTGVTTMFDDIGTGTAQQIGIDQYGNFSIVWVGSTGSNTSEILFSRYDPRLNGVGGFTNSAQVISTTVNASNSTPKLAVSNTGYAVIAWLQNGFPVAVSFNPNVSTDTQFSPPLTSSPLSLVFLPAAFGLFGTTTENGGFAVVNSFANSANPQGAIEISTITIP